MSFIKLNKLGSASSEVFTSDKIFKKIHRLATKEEAEAVFRGINLLHKTIPTSVELPVVWTIKEEVLVSRGSRQKASLIQYEQVHLKPWIKETLIGSAQLEVIGRLIIKQQEILLKEELCLVDARPSNYWLGSCQPRLVDLASIKLLSKHSLESFLADFLRHIIHPLLLEQQLGLPVSSYFKAGLASINIRTTGLLKSYQSISFLKEMGRQFIVDRVSNLISSASVDFISFLREEAALIGHEDKISTKKIIQHGLHRIRRMDKLLTRICQNQHKSSSDWLNYNQVHCESYLQAKQEAVEKFLKESDQDTRVADLGANLTCTKQQRVDLLIDKDLTLCRKLWDLRGENAHVLQIDVAAALASPESDEFKALNLGGVYEEALVLGLIHHLQIDAGLATEAFYSGLYKLYKRILVEFPSTDDPMVQLLIQKKGEEVKWSWTEQQIKANKYFEVAYTKKLSKTRIIACLVRSPKKETQERI